MAAKLSFCVGFSHSTMMLNTRQQQQQSLMSTNIQDEHNHWT